FALQIASVSDSCKACDFALPLTSHSRPVVVWSAPVFVTLQGQANMALNLTQRIQRIAVRLDELTYWRERESIPVTGWTANGSPIEEGAPWPTRDGVVAFTAKVEGAGNWPVGETRLFVDLGGE